MLRKEVLLDLSPKHPLRLVLPRVIRQGPYWQRKRVMLGLQGGTLSRLTVTAVGSGDSGVWWCAKWKPADGEPERHLGAQGLQGTVRVPKSS